MHSASAWIWGYRAAANAPAPPSRCCCQVLAFICFFIPTLPFFFRSNSPMSRNAFARTRACYQPGSPPRKCLPLRKILPNASHRYISTSSRFSAPCRRDKASMSSRQRVSSRK
ncbi:hypothetical protein GQ53DRAFT_379620 [Thozetella sp. PMI_491]|nr:hypothetical protein GQ53DRAFT_379620 [Thozetella sp. PMI_491]